MPGGPETGPGDEKIYDLRQEVSGGRKSKSAIEADKRAAMEQGMETASVDEGQMTEPSEKPADEEAGKLPDAA